MRKVAVVAAGGTGGHLFPAQALAEALIARGWRVVLATDTRGAAYAGAFPADQRIPPSPRPSSRATRSAWRARGWPSSVAFCRRARPLHGCGRTWWSALVAIPR